LNENLNNRNNKQPDNENCRVDCKVRRFLEDATIKFFNDQLTKVYMNAMPEKIILKVDKTIEYVYTEATQKVLDRLNKQKLNYIKAKFSKVILYKKNA